MKAQPAFHGAKMLILFTVYGNMDETKEEKSKSSKRNEYFALNVELGLQWEGERGGVNMHGGWGKGAVARYTAGGSPLHAHGNTSAHTPKTRNTIFAAADYRRTQVGAQSSSRG